MRRSNERCPDAAFGSGLLAIALLLVGADGPKRTVEAQGLSFLAPGSWKSSPPTSPMRLAVLKVEPVEGDDFPAELVVFRFPGGAGTVEANVKRWQDQFKDQDGNPPKIQSRTVKGKNVDVTRVETSGHYHPAQFGGRPEPDRPDSRLLGAIIVTDQVGYFIKMVGPNRTMTKIRPDFDELLGTIHVEK